MRLDSEESLVLRWAAMSRLAVWLVGALSHALITPYDRSAALPSSLGAAGASAPAEAAAVVAGPPPLLDGAVDALIAPFANWDGVYFVRIAEASAKKTKDYVEDLRTLVTDESDQVLLDLTSTHQTGG